jgi:hypothetical protein
MIVGSQAILGAFTEDELPFYATRSLEIDILPIADDNSEIACLANVIEGVAGEFSPFAQLHGFSIDGVDLGDLSATRRLARTTDQDTEPEHSRPIG